MHFVLFTYYQLLKLILYFQFILNAFTNIVLLLNHIYLCVGIFCIDLLISWMIISWSLHRFRAAPDQLKPEQT